MRQPVEVVDVDAALLGPLVGLALVDSTSFGTLLIPLWLMLTPGQVRPGRVVLFLFTVAGFYLLLGVGLATVASSVLDQVGDGLDSTAARIAQGVVGAALLVLGSTIEPWTKAGKAKRTAARARTEAVRGPGRLARWRSRAMAGGGSAAAIMALGVTAAGVEAASMVPYLAAIGLLAASGLDLPAVVLVLVGYCLLMVLPALVLLGVRAGLHDRVVPLLARLEAWMTRNSREALAWVLFLLGLFLLADALTSS